MAFVDEARIFVHAGDGGKGCESFYRDKFMRHPRPDGGDGGRGGDIVAVADGRIQTLLDYRFRQHYEAGRGGHGSSKNKKGRRGEECRLRLPVGTIIRDLDTGLLIKDMRQDGDTVVIAQGGNGGRGNNQNRTPLPPGEGERRTIHLELKIIADVGIVGFPNAGKSTLISAISKVKSKIANYPFTTRQPILGVVRGDESDFVVADLPGLIEGAHTGRGLGDRFLKHAERTKVLLHLIDMAGSEGRDPLEDFAKISEELQEYRGLLSRKQRIVVANKMDLPDAEDHLNRFRQAHPGLDVLAVSAVTGDQLDVLVARLHGLVAEPSADAQ